MMWLFRLALAASVLVGQFWNGQPREELGVYMIVLAFLVAAALVVESTRPRSTR